MISLHNFFSWLQDKKTALYWAVEKGHDEVVRALLKANPNLELCTRVSDDNSILFPALMVFSL